MTLGGIRFNYEARNELERAYLRDRASNSALEGGPIEAASTNGALDSRGNGASGGQPAHTSGGSNGHSRSGRTGNKPPAPPRVRTEASFHSDDRHRIARRAMAAPEFGKLTQIAREEATSPLAVYHFCEELDVTAVRQPPDRQMKRAVVARLKAGEDAAAIATETGLPLEILVLWRQGRNSEEEMLAYLGKTIRFSTHVVSDRHDEEALAIIAETAYLPVKHVLAKHQVNERTFHDWKKRFQSPLNDASD